MKKYLGMYILNPNLTQEQIKANIEDINNIFTSKGGNLVSIEEWGMRDLAYEINYLTKGYYVKFVVEANNESVAEYDRICNIKEDVIRHILTKEE